MKSVFLPLALVVLLFAGGCRKSEPGIAVTDVYTFEELQETPEGYALLGQTYYVHDTNLHKPEYTAKSEARKRKADKVVLFKKYIRTDNDPATNASIPVYEVRARFYKKN